MAGFGDANEIREDRVWSAGAWGVLALTPLYFMFDMISRQHPPPITHPQFYYGFAGVTIAWQFAFFVIATDPARFRPMMIPSMLEKLGYVIAVIVLYLQRRMSPVQLMTGVRGTLLGLLFVIAFFKTRRGPEARRLFLPSVVSSWRAWPAIRPPALSGPVFEPLRDPAVFRQFQIHPEFHTLVWPNGADFAPEFLRDNVRVTA